MSFRSITEILAPLIQAQTQPEDGMRTLSAKFLRQTTMSSWLRRIQTQDGDSGADSWANTYAGNPPIRLFTARQGGFDIPVRPHQLPTPSRSIGK